jgi:hypothetical protein
MADKPRTEQTTQRHSTDNMKAVRIVDVGWPKLINPQHFSLQPKSSQDVRITSLKQCYFSDALPARHTRSHVTKPATYFRNRHPGDALVGKRYVSHTFISGMAKQTQKSFVVGMVCQRPDAD